MDKTQEDLNKASHVLLDAEVRLNTIRIQRQQLERDIATLTMVEANIEENMRVLKRKYVAVMIFEFKKARDNLNTARTRRAFLRVDRENVLKVERQAETVYEKARLDYEKVFDLLHNPVNNVVYVDFGRKNGNR